MTTLLEPNAWRGVWTALITPLKKSPDGLVIDAASLADLIETQIDAGIHGLVIAGSTGEGSLLNDSTYKELLKEAKRIAGKRLRLVAGLGIGGTESCLKNLALAKDLGYDGVLASPPAYVKAPQRGLVEHYLRLGQEELPICVYEVAGRAGSSIDVSTLAEICNSKEKGARMIVATKDASAKMERALETSRLIGNRIALLSGDDFTWAPFIACGGAGLISVVSHLTPRALTKIWVDSVNNDRAAAVAEQNRITPLIDALFWDSNPIPVKSVLHALGQIRELHFQSPLLPMKADRLSALKELALTTPDARGSA